MKALKMEKRAKFLCKCVEFNLIPNFLRFRVPNNGVFNDVAVNNFQRRLLKNEVSRTHRMMKELSNDISVCRSLVQTKIPSILWGSIVHVLHYSHLIESLKLDKTHNDKLIRLSEQYDRPLKSSYENVKVLDNSIILPEYVQNCLAMGPKHPTLEKFKTKDVLAETDCLLEFLENKIIRNSE